MGCEQSFGGASTLTGTENPGVAKQAKSSIANSQRLNCPPLLLPLLGNANFSGRKGVEVASSFLCVPVGLPPFPAAGSLLCSAGGCVENQFVFSGCLNKFKLGLLQVSYS